MADKVDKKIYREFANTAIVGQELVVSEYDKPTAMIIIKSETKHKKVFTSKSIGNKEYCIWRIQ